MLPLEATGLVPAWGTKIPHALQEKKKKKKKKKKEGRKRGREEGRERKSVTTSNLRKDVRFEHSAKDGREFPEDGQVGARGILPRGKWPGKDYPKRRH